jgi:selenocysteine-specific elongation factor
MTAEPSEPQPAVPATDEDLGHESILNVNIGVLGHVDSGKTSLVKALSTLLSTAALDKSKQSRQRGMTLDLGFSCFFLPEMPPHLQATFPSKQRVQITLVDCPGHASLIRTIIGGAQIIDMVLLVVDAVKGWQAQTTECLVLAELTSPRLLVALNKVDQFPLAEREERIREATAKVYEKLAQTTRFARAPTVGVAACVGGEKAAAVGAGSTTTAAVTTTDSHNETYQMDQLVNLLRYNLPIPRRDQIASNNFLFSIDHCFPIRGRGTVLTGTVLAGAIAVNDVLEFPALQLQRKVKSLQMFQQSVPAIAQGDRAGLCVSHLDSKLLERGLAAAPPGGVPLVSGAIALVRKVPYYPLGLRSGAKFHVSVGHSTIMATVRFWGGCELAAGRGEALAAGASAATPQVEEDEAAAVTSMSLGGNADLAGLPKMDFDFTDDFLQQDELVESIDGVPGSYLHWALLDFSSTPIYCPMDTLVIGSRLDLATKESTAGNDVTSCRLAFSGRLVRAVDPAKDAHRLKLYTPKERRGVIAKLGEAFRRADDEKVVRYEVFGADLFKKETNLKVFLGMKVRTPGGDMGVIKSSYGTDGRIRVVFPAGTEAKEGEALILRFKRYVHDPAKGMHQDETLPAERAGVRIAVEKKKSKKQSLPEGINRVGQVSAVKGDVLANGKYPLAILAGFFAPAINIKERAGARVFLPSTKEEGTILGPFGKAGKCKVSFAEGISAAVGAKAELHLS